jgi:hypothetical protein
MILSSGDVADWIREDNEQVANERLGLAKGEINSADNAILLDEMAA